MIKDDKNRLGFKRVKFGLIPVDWGYHKLEDITLKITDGAHTSPPSVNSDFEYPIFSVKNMSSNDFSRSVPRYIAKVDFENLIKQGCKPEINDILIAKDGSVLKYCFVMDSDFQGVLLSSIAILKPDLSQITPYYISQYLKQPSVQSYVTSVLTSGSGVPRIILSDFRKLELPVPPLQEQKKIAQILGKWDQLIESQAKLIRVKEKQKKGLIQRLLTGKGRFNGFNDEWAEIEIQELGQVIRGASPRPKGDPRYYGGNVPRLMVQDVTRDGKYVRPSIDFLTEEGASKSRPCKAGTLTIVCSGDVGTPSFLAVDACIHDGFLAITDLDAKKIDKDFLYYQMYRLKERMERSATHGGIFTNLTTTILKEFIIGIPSVKEQRLIAKTLNKCDVELQLQYEKLSVFQKQKNGLMQQLLTGKIRVKV